MTSIIGIPTTRVSDSFVRTRLLTQVQFDQAELFSIEMQLSTGHSFQLPSEQPIAALRVMSLQRLIERKDQVMKNVDTNSSYLSATDTALSAVSSLIADTRGVAIGVMGTTSTDIQRAAAAQQVTQACQQLMDTANQKFRGRYLFTGSNTTVCPFELTNTGVIEYKGNEGAIKSYADIDLLLTTNLQGNEVFGAISEPVQGTANLDPVLLYDTRLADLRGGLGISPGSIAVSDGSSVSIVDISNAETIGDVARMIKDNPPVGRSMQVEVTPDGLWLEIDGGDLTIREVGGGITADELGILRESGMGTAPIIGGDLDPTLRKTTDLQNILGSRARAIATSAGPDNDLIFTADDNGFAWNGVTIDIVDTAVKGAETVAWDGATNTMTIGIEAGASQAFHVVNAVQAAHAAGIVEFTCELDPTDVVKTGLGLVDIGTSTTQYGSGDNFDKTSGLIIENGGQSFNISLTTCQTVEDVLNKLNGAGAGVQAEINDSKTGINIRSRLSGYDFTIGENGGDTASDLGLRTFDTDTRLEDLNFGRGVHTYDGTDFTITSADGTNFEIDIDGIDTVGAVINKINLVGGGVVAARLKSTGNGIQVIDQSTGTGTLSIARAPLSMAAIDLGLIPEGVESNSDSGSYAHAQAYLGVGNARLRFQAKTAGTEMNGATVQYVDTGTVVGAGGEIVTYNSVSKTLTIDIDTGASTALDIQNAVQLHLQANSLFAVTPTGDGTGFPPVPTIGVLSGGSQELSGTDVNPEETDGLFTALIRLENALLNNDTMEMQRAIDMLDRNAQMRMNFARAELGAREQGLEVLKYRLETEHVELQSALSDEYDVDFVQVMSDLAAKQAAYEASLRATGQILQLSLLNFI